MINRIIRVNIKNLPVFIIVEILVLLILYFKYKFMLNIGFSICRKTERKHQRNIKNERP